MRAIAALFLFFALAGSGLAQQTLFFDDFSYADTEIANSLSTLREDIWKLRPNGIFTCHTINLPEVGGVVFPMQMDEGQLDGAPSGVHIQCVADSIPRFRIDPGSIYTYRVVFRITDYEAYFNFHNGFRISDQNINVTPQIEKNMKTGADELYLVVSGLGVNRYTSTNVNVRPYTGQWLTMETTVNTQSADRITTTTRLRNQEGSSLAVVSLLLTDPREMAIVLGRSFGLHNHPNNFLTASPRVIEIKEVRVTKL